MNSLTNDNTCVPRIPGHARMGYSPNESYIQYILKVTISNYKHQTYALSYGGEWAIDVQFNCANYVYDFHNTRIMTHNQWTLDYAEILVHIPPIMKKMATVPCSTTFSHS
jgi:hypothetical protein